MKSVTKTITNNTGSSMTYDPGIDLGRLHSFKVTAFSAGQTTKNPKGVYYVGAYDENMIGYHTSSSYSAYGVYIDLNGQFTVGSIYTSITVTFYYFE